MWNGRRPGAERVGRLRISEELEPRFCISRSVFGSTLPGRTPSRSTGYRTRLGRGVGRAHPDGVALAPGRAPASFCRLADVDLLDLGMEERRVEVTLEVSVSRRGSVRGRSRTLKARLVHFREAVGGTRRSRVGWTRKLLVRKSEDDERGEALARRGRRVAYSGAGVELARERVGGPVTQARSSSAVRRASTGLPIFVTPRGQQRSRVTASS